MNNNNSRFDEILDILKDISERQELTEQIIESYFDILFRRLSKIELELKHITDLLTKKIQAAGEQALTSFSCFSFYQKNRSIILQLLPLHLLLHLFL